VTSRYRFELATAADDAQLRARMAEDRMEGRIAVSFRREPSYFAGCRVQGEETQVVKCVDTESGRIVLVGSRSTSLHFVDGAPLRIGYLADLRLAPDHRRGMLLRTGNRFFSAMHARDPVPFYVTVIYEGNAPALGTLLGARAGLPEYRDAGRILTPAIPLEFPRRPIGIDGIEVKRGSEATLPAIVEFLNTWQSRKQFAPVYRVSDFPAGRFLGMRLEDFFLALSGGRIVATLAAWDQVAVRQTHVERYSPGLRVLRPLYNLASRLTPLKPLPREGTRIPCLVLSCAAAENNDVKLFRCVLRAAYNGLRGGPWHYAIAGLHESDPLAAALQDYRRIPAAGRLFTVHVPGTADRAESQPRIPYMEPGCL
jgi:hypothetical protein